MDADQVARNDAVYRDANERINHAAEDYDVSGPLPFICECADPECHRRHAEGAREHAEIVRKAGDYIAVEKIGQAGEVVEELDPDSRESRRG